MASVISLPQPSVVAEAAKAAGIEFPVHPHMLRHATGYYLTNAGQGTRTHDPALPGRKEYIQHTVPIYRTGFRLRISRRIKSPRSAIRWE